MLGKFKRFPDFIIPLSTHCAVHAMMTFVLCKMFGFPLWFVLVDFVSHFIIDRIKADKNLLGRWKSDDKRFWWALGLDQFLHHIVLLICLFCIVQ